MIGDGILVERAKQGDRHALEQLLDRHLAMVYRFVGLRIGPHHADLDDVVQETLIAAARSIRSLRTEKEGSVPKWILGIARHKVADHYRHSASRQQLSDAGRFAAVVSNAPLDAQEIVAERDRDQRLREALHALTKEQEEVLTLRFVLGFAGHEVAEMTGRSAGAVKALQHRGLASLERLLGVDRVEEWP